MGLFLKLNDKGEIVNSKMNTAVETQIQATIFECFEENLRGHDFNKHFSLMKPETKERGVKEFIFARASIKIMNHYYKETNWNKWRYLFGNEQKFVLNLELYMAYSEKDSKIDDSRTRNIFFDFESLKIIPWSERWNPTREQLIELTKWFKADSL